jgi:hypothetical protein
MRKEVVSGAGRGNFCPFREIGQFFFRLLGKEIVGKTDGELSALM